MRAYVYIFAATLLLSGLQAQNPMFISSIDKTNAPAGDTITIAGRGFGTTASNIRVFFGGARAAELTEIRDGLIEVQVPAGATFDNITLVDVNRRISASSSGFFMLSFSPGTGSFDAANFTTKPNIVELSVPFGSGTMPFYSLCTCDFDGDGAMDVAGAAAPDLAEIIAITSIPIS